MNDQFKVQINNIQEIISNLQKMVVNPHRVSPRKPQMKYNNNEQLMK